MIILAEELLCESCMTKLPLISEQIRVLLSVALMQIGLTSVIEEGIPRVTVDPTSQVPT